MQALSSSVRARGFLAFLFAVVCCVVWAPVTLAQSESSSASSSESSASESASADSSKAPEASGASGGEGSADSKAMLILDASSSMLEDDADGPRIDAAKQASKDLVESLPGTAQMGLMVYGAKESDAPDNRDRGCKDIETLAPVGEIDKDKFNKAIDGVTPKGYTPMGNSLREAAKELGDEGQRSIILVSDGIDSCAPPPVCEVAKELAEEGVDLAIHTVGFKVDEEARKELQCIADAGKGQFLEADDAGSLADSLKFLTQRDVGKYQLKGTKFEFADNPEDAKWLDEGQYQTKVTPDTNAKKDRFFRISVPEGHNAHVTVTPVWQTNGGVHHGDLSVASGDIVNEKDPECGTARDWGSSSTTNNAEFGIDPFELTFSRHDTMRNDGKANTCDMSSWIIPLQVYPDGDKISEDVNLEVNVFYEPLPDEEQGEEWSDRKLSFADDVEGDLPIENAESVTGGTGFNDAVEISEGSYSDRIVPGEYRFYKIPVKWGERPVIKAKTPKSEVKEADAIGFGFYDPLRSPADDGKLIFFDKDVEVGPIGPKEHAWYGERPQGYYFVWFGMGSKGEGEVTGVEQPYEFAVKLDGEPADGGMDWEPTYEDGQEPSDEPIKFDSAKNDDSKKDSENDDDGAGAADEDESGRPSWLLALVIGSGLLLLLLIGLLVVLLRRKNKGATSRVDAGDDVRRDPRDGSTAQFGQAEQYRQPSQPGQQGPGTPNRPENPYGPGTSNGPGANPYA